MEFVATIRQQLKDFFAKMERGQIIRLILLLALIVIVSIVAVVLISHTTYAPLPVSADAAQMGVVDARLTELGVKKRTDDQGQILVPEDQVNSLVWKLSSEGIFDTGFDYGWIEKGTGFSSTESTQTAYATVQAQENLKRMINSFHKVADSYVYLNFEQESPFVYSAERRESTAAVQIILADPDNPLTPEEGKALRDMIRMAGGGLKDENIQLVDNLYNYYDGVVVVEDEADVPFTDRLAMQKQVQEYWQTAIRKFLEPVFGVGRVDAVVSAELNFDQETVQSIVFAPPVDGMETGLPIAWKELYETVNNADELAQGEPGLDENGGAPSYIEETVIDADSIYKKISKEVNAEVNEVKTMIERAQGNVVGLSVGVLIPMDEEGDDYTEQVRSLISGAVGFPPEYVAVERLPMAESPDFTAAYAQISQQAEQYELIKLLIIIGAIVLIVVLLLIALRTVLRALRPVPEVVEGEFGDGMLDMLVGDEGELALAGEPPAETPVSQIQKFIDKDPESVAQLLRNWLTDDYR